MNLFVLTSGYFSINPSKKSLIRLLSQVYFYAVGIFALFLIFQIPYDKNVNWWKILNAVPDCYWFITSYFILYLIAPVLNEYIVNVKKSRLLIYIILYFSVLCYYTINGVKETLGFNSVFLFIGLYLIGRYLKLYYKPSGKIFVYFSVYILMSLMIAFYAIVCKIYMNDETSTFYLRGGIYSNPLVVIQSVIGFLFFINLKLQNKFINYIAASALAVYLIHMHPVVKEYYYSYCKSLYTYSSFEHFLKLSAFVIIVYIISICIDKIRLLLFNRIYALFKYDR